LKMHSESIPRSLLQGIFKTPETSPLFRGFIPFDDKSPVKSKTLWTLNSVIR